MNALSRLSLAAAVALCAAPPALAQDVQVASAATRADEAPKDSAPPAPAKASLVRNIELQHIRPLDQRGLNTFEWPKSDKVPFTGFKLQFGAAFAQQRQDLSHGNTADAVVPAGGTANVNQLMGIGLGFNLATANLYLDAQLAPGIRVALTSYLSSRHHQETWVKDGYLLIDGSPIHSKALDKLFEYLTIRAGHFEVNYGDYHFRRSDNGNAMYNPFVGNLIMDAFTTEIGGEVYVRGGPGLLAMVGATGGVNKGDVTNPDNRGPAFYGKVGFDRQLTPDLRVRLTGSGYSVAKTPSATLFAGDRAGSRYYMVLENTTATTDKQASSGSINPGFGAKLTTFQINPFVKYQGLELFGVIEQAKGRSSAETEQRTVDQYDVEAVYRFLANDELYVGAKYNTITGDLWLKNPATNASSAYDVSADRWALGAGWFITPSVLAKIEYVSQKYHDFPSWDIRNGGKFDGVMVEGVVAF